MSRNAWGALCVVILVTIVCIGVGVASRKMTSKEPAAAKVATMTREVPISAGATSARWALITRHDDHGETLSELSTRAPALTAEERPVPNTPPARTGLAWFDDLTEKWYGEARDREWSGNMETYVRSMLTLQDPDNLVENVDCRATLCRVVFTTGSPQTLVRFQKQMSQDGQEFRYELSRTDAGISAIAFLSRNDQAGRTE